MKKVKAAFFNDIDRDQQIIDQVYACGSRQKVADITDLYPEVISSENFEQHLDNLKDVEVIFSTWGMLPLTEAQIDMLPSLKAVFYGAGSIKGFAEPFLKKGIKVSTAWKANATPVSEFCLGQVLLAAKSYHLNLREYHSSSYKGKTDYDKAFRGPGAYNIKCTLIGAGEISLQLQELLKPFNIETLIVPSRSERRTVSLKDAFASSFIVSNHLPDRQDNINTITGDMLRSMPYGGTFINTGRGAQLNEEELIEVMKERPDLSALLDVTEPEPVPVDSELLKLPNVYLTTHIAGSMNNELVRMADYVIDDFKHWQKGEAMENEVNFEQFLAMA